MLIERFLWALESDSSSPGGDHPPKPRGSPSVVASPGKLADAAHRVAGGDFSARTGVLSNSTELYEVSQTFDLMIARLESQFEAQRRFVADASHELKTPVTALEGSFTSSNSSKGSSGIPSRPCHPGHATRTPAYGAIDKGSADPLPGRADDHPMGSPFASRTLQAAVASALAAAPGRSIQSSPPDQAYQLIGEEEALEGSSAICSTTPPAYLPSRRVCLTAAVPLKDSR